MQSDSLRLPQVRSAGRRSLFSPTVFSHPVPWPALALLVLLATCSAHGQAPVSPSRSQVSDAQPGSIQFTDVAAAAGITFVHYRGNEGTPINREIFAPGVCV